MRVTFDEAEDRLLHQHAPDGGVLDGAPEAFAELRCFVIEE